MKSPMYENVKATLYIAVVVLSFGGLLYFCEVMPMQECMEKHSLVYCNKLLNK